MKTYTEANAKSHADLDVVARPRANVVATHSLNKRESLRSELIERHGRTIVRIGRWKADSDGALRPAGVGIECSADHIDGFAAMLAATKHRLAHGGS